MCVIILYMSAQITKNNLYGYGPFSIALRIFYLVFDGILPIIAVGYFLRDSVATEFVWIGLSLAFILTMVQYSFLVEEGNAPKTNRQFGFALLIPFFFVGIEWLITGGSLFYMWITLSFLYILGRTIGHYLSVFAAPMFTKNLDSRTRKQYYKSVTAPLLALALFMIYPFIAGVQLLIAEQFAALPAWQAYTGLAILLIGLIVHSIRFAKMINPQGFIDYVLSQ